MLKNFAQRFRWSIPITSENFKSKARIFLAQKPGDENPFAESYLFYEFVDDGFSKRV